MLQLTCESGVFELNSVFLRNSRILLESYLLVTIRLKVWFRQLGKDSSMSQVFTGLDSP